MDRNIIEKIWDSHIAYHQQGHPSILKIDLQIMHEVTSPQAFEMLRTRKLSIKDNNKILATIDHVIPTDKNRKYVKDIVARNQMNTLRKNTKDFNIKLFDIDSGNQGIVHVFSPEIGAIQPGMTIVCGDSHTSTHGAFGALAFGIGTSEVGIAMATGCLLQKHPKTMKVEFKGKLKKHVFSKDMILQLISKIGIDGANGHIIEYTGNAIKTLSMEARMTICNMSIECGARAGIITPDEITFEYLKNKQYAPKDIKSAIEYWKSFISDKNATYDKYISIDINNLEPIVTWGTNPAQNCKIDGQVPNDKHINSKNALQYTKLSSNHNIAGTKIDWGFIGSCTNGRIEDLRIVAKILKGRKIHKNVRLYIVPGSEQVRKHAQQEKLDKIFEDSNAEFRMPGCSMCLAMNPDKVPAGKRCISSSNRNFIGRQGTGSITHLASPATVAASCIAGEITSPAKYFI